MSEQSEKTSWEDGLHFQSLVTHLEAFDEARLAELAALYAIEESAAEAIARGWCSQPATLLAVADRELDAPAWSLLTDLAYEHDITIEIGWADKGARDALVRLGFVRPNGRRRAREAALPAALAAIVAPRLRGTPTTFPTLLGAMEEAEVVAIAERFDVEAEHHIGRVLALSEAMSAPHAIEELVWELPDPEYLGAALMILELGGMCYWQEVLGVDPQAGGGEEKVVPLMRSEDRAMERDIAQTLLEAGVIFRVERDGRQTMAVVPEELWAGLWTLGRSWLMEWTAIAFDHLEEGATKRTERRERGDLQRTLKWLACEADKGNLRVDEEGPSASTLAHLTAIGGRDEACWRGQLELGFELGAFRRRRDHKIELYPSFEPSLDLPRVTFARQVLFDWITGYVGRVVDRQLPTALGLDEDWRALAVELLQSRDEFVPAYMLGEGVRQELTGAGILRNVEESGADSLSAEIGLTNGLLWTEKLIWLDLLSMVESERWYAIGHLTELFQLAASFAVFSQVLHVLEQPHLGLYLPVQRASFLTDPYHTEAFDGWVRDIVTHLFEPLGVGMLSEDGERVWLEPSALRVETPPGLPEQDRIDLVREILDDPDLDFTPPAVPNHHLRKVVVSASEAELELDAPLRDVRAWARKHDIVAFDGRRLLARAQAGGH